MNTKILSFFFGCPNEKKMMCVCVQFSIANNNNNNEDLVLFCFFHHLSTWKNTMHQYYECENVKFFLSSSGEDILIFFIENFA